MIGRVGGSGISLKEEAVLALADLRATHEDWLPRYMGAA